MVSVAHDKNDCFADIKSVFNTAHWYIFNTAHWYIIFGYWMLIANQSYALILGVYTDVQLHDWKAAFRTLPAPPLSNAPSLKVHNELLIA
jgi:hypothetical protein